MPGYVSAPPPPSGGFGPLVGALVLIEVHSFEPQAITPWGLKDQAQVTIRVVEHPTDPMMNGQTIGTPVVNTVLVSQLRSLVGQTTLGRVVLGAQTKGNAPVKLDPPTPADEAKADQFLAANPAGAPAPAGQAQAAQQAAQYGQQPGQPAYGQMAPPPGYPAAQPVQPAYPAQTAPQGPPQGYPAPAPAYVPNGAQNGAQPAYGAQPPQGYPGQPPAVPSGQPVDPPF